MGAEPKTKALLGLSINDKNLENAPPAWHRDYLADRQIALANGDDYFITLDELEVDLRTVLEGTK